MGHKTAPLAVLALAAGLTAQTVDVRFEVGSRLVRDENVPAGVSSAAASFLARRVEVGRGLRIVHRPVPPGMSPLEAAIRATVAGPTPQEASIGLYSHLPPGTTLAGLAITGDQVAIDFSKEVLEGLTDHVVESIFDEFKSTIGDFPEIRSIRLTCGGQALRLTSRPFQTLAGEPRVSSRPLRWPMTRASRRPARSRSTPWRARRSRSARRTGASGMVPAGTISVPTPAAWATPSWKTSTASGSCSSSISILRGRRRPCWSRAI